MPTTMQAFLAQTTRKAAADLEAAVLRLPDDKRSWSPMGNARSAVNQAAECAIMNGSTADLIQQRVWQGCNDSVTEFILKRDELAKDWNAVQALLHQNTEAIVAAIQAVPDEDLEVEVQMPWGPMKLSQILAYPYWNMSYHEGQVNYIASMLEG